MLRLREALEVLPSPYALERYSSLTGESVVVVDFADTGEAPAPPATRRLRDALAERACPTIGVCARETAASAALIDRFDVVVAEPDAATPLIAAVGRTPLAAQALVQLLRQGDHLGLHDALGAESLVYSTLQSGPEVAAWLAGRRRPTALLLTS